MKKLTPLKANILVDEFEMGEQRSAGGIIIKEDDMIERGIRERWCRVHSKGPKATDVEIGQWVLVDHGRWTHGFEYDFGDGKRVYRWIDYKDILIVQDEKPEGITTL